MKKRIKKNLWFVSVLALASFLVSGCLGNDTENTTENHGVQLSGYLKLAGSTSMEKLANALAESFMEENPKVSVTTEFIGSSAGIEATLNGTAHIGNASRSLSSSEKEKGAADNVVAIDGIAVIANNDTAMDLTKEQLVGIYKGNIKNWRDVGGKDSAVVVVGREAGSGTRNAFEELLEIENACSYANELDSTGAILAKVAATPGAIGYVSLDVLNDSVTPLKIDGAAPTEENIRTGDYVLSRPFIMATKGEIQVQNDLVKAWFDYIASAKGQEIIKKVGLITLN